MTFVTLLRCLLLLAFFVASYSTIINEQLGSEWFGLSIIFYILVILILSFTKVKAVQPLFIYFIFLSIFWILFRSIVLNFSDESVNYRYLLDFDFNDMAWTIFMISISSIFLVFGIVLGGLKGPSKINFKVPLLSTDINRKIFAPYFLLLVVIIVYQNTGYMATITKLTAVISMFLSTDTLLILAIAVIVTRQKMPSWDSYLIIFTLFLYVVVRVVVGSKSGIFYIGLGLLVNILAVNHLYKFNSKYIIILAILVPIAFIIFLLGTEVRKISYSLTMAGDFSNSFHLIRILFEQRDIILNELDFQFFFNTFSRRISMFDYLIVFFNAETNTDHLGIIYGLKTFWNVITPPFVAFDDALVFQANLFKVAYGSETYQEQLQNYHSDMLPLFGTLYGIFGNFCLIFVSLFGYIFSRIYIIIDNIHFSEKYCL
ncbi:hypothetical protein N9Y82_02975, partial [Amylibacter sp.]|nr:hypothetical protein [Amylibacter sp.]